MVVPQFFLKYIEKKNLHLQKASLINLVLQYLDDSGLLISVSTESFDNRGFI